MSTTFSYDPRSPNDVTRVRFHTGQTVQDESLISDEDIAFAISEEGSWQRAVVACIKLIIARLSKPDFRADWLQVNHGAAVASFEKLLTQKRWEFGIPAGVTGVVHVYRADSLQTEEPNWTAES